MLQSLNALNTFQRIISADKDKVVKSKARGSSSCRETSSLIITHDCKHMARRVSNHSHPSCKTSQTQGLLSTFVYSLLITNSYILSRSQKESLSFQHIYIKKNHATTHHHLSFYGNHPRRSEWKRSGSEICGACPKSG